MIYFILGKVILLKVKDALKLVLQFRNISIWPMTRKEGGEEKRQTDSQKMMPTISSNHQCNSSRQSSAHYMIHLVFRITFHLHQVFTTNDNMYLQLLDTFDYSVHFDSQTQQQSAKMTNQHHSNATTTTIIRCIFIDLHYLQLERENESKKQRDFSGGNPIGWMDTLNTYVSTIWGVVTS
jgi:hypothetical protein